MRAVSTRARAPSRARLGRGPRVDGSPPSSSRIGASSASPRGLRQRRAEHRLAAQRADAGLIEDRAIGVALGRERARARAPCRAPCGCSDRGATAGRPRSPGGSAASSSSSASWRRSPPSCSSSSIASRTRASRSSRRPRRRICDPPHDHRQAPQGQSHRRLARTDRGRRAPRRRQRRASRSTKRRARLDFYFDIADPWSYLDGAGRRAGSSRPTRSSSRSTSSRRRPPTSIRAPDAARQARGARRPAARRVLGRRLPRQEGSRLRAWSATSARALIRERPAREQLQRRARARRRRCGRTIARSARRSCSARGAPSRTARSRRSSTRTTPSCARPATTRARMLAVRRRPGTGASIACPTSRPRSRRDLGTDVAHVVTPRPETERGPLELSEKPLTCEMWFSFRSPYSYLALEQIEAVLAPYDVPLVLRPIAADGRRAACRCRSVKRMYIVRDAKREADRLGIPFGELCDPLGTGVDNCLAIAHWADAARRAGSRSRARRCAASGPRRATWPSTSTCATSSSAPDCRGTRRKAALGEPEAAEVGARPTRPISTVIGLWGVPSFRCGDFVAWGQDRLPLLADRLRRHAPRKSLVNPSSAACYQPVGPMPSGPRGRTDMSSRSRRRRRARRRGRPGRSGTVEPRPAHAARRHRVRRIRGAARVHRCCSRCAAAARRCGCSCRARRCRSRARCSTAPPAPSCSTATPRPDDDEPSTVLRASSATSSSRSRRPRSSARCSSASSTCRARSRSAIALGLAVWPASLARDVALPRFKRFRTSCRSPRTRASRAPRS